MAMSAEYVFAYGSLLHDLGVAVKACRLRNYRRAWNVAMDNSRSLPGYKYYLSAADLSRPAVFVTFLNLVPAKGKNVSGMLFPVDIGELATLDQRERNYDRHDVTQLLEQPVDGRVWTYRGKATAERRFALATAEGRAVIDKRYLDAVRGGFERIAADALDEFDATTDPHRCAVVDLLRVDLD
jgi:cation transport regulator ChaC